MKRIIYYLILIVTIFLVRCSDDVALIQPADISNIRSESMPGSIKLQWDVPSDMNYEYVRISYYDPLSKKENVKLASVYSDSIVISGTRAKYGEYTFTLQPFSSTNTPGNVHQYKASSGPAPASYVLADGTGVTIPLSVEMLSTNAQEPTHAHISNLVDGNSNTYFHTAWTISIGAPHYFQVALKDPVRAIRYSYISRHDGNGGGDVKRMKVEASNDGENWSEVAIQELALPSGRATETSADAILMPNEFSYLRFTPLARRGADPINNTFFDMAEFILFEMPVIVIDPEAPDEDD